MSALVPHTFPYTNTKIVPPVVRASRQHANEARVDRQHREEYS